MNLTQQVNAPASLEEHEKHKLFANWTTPRSMEKDFIDDNDPYESLPETSNVTTHMLAGAAAGIMEHSVMYPLDCVKTRMQSLVPDPKANYQSLADAFSKIIREEGIRNTVRGINAMVVGAGPAHALYFAFYEKLKKTLSAGQKGNHLAHGIAGCGATLLHDAVMNPAEVVKQRMQVYGSTYRTCFQCMCSVFRSEGPKAFYRSYTTQLTMNIPFQSTHFIMYEVMQDFMNNDRQYNPKTHMVSGAVAGAVAASVTMPLDVCKTLLNTQEHCARTKISYVNGLAEACRTIMAVQGLPGFFRGLQARVVYQMPSTAISWSVYEFFKFVISRQSQEKDVSTPVSAMQVAAAAPSR